MNYVITFHVKFTKKKNTFTLIISKSLVIFFCYSQSFSFNNFGNIQHNQIIWGRSRYTNNGSKYTHTN